MTKPQKQLIFALGTALAVWYLPFVQILALPLIYLNTHLHELCHALAALGTGGSVDQIRVFGSGGGDAAIRGGSILVIASAGYLGASAIGCALVAWARDEARARQSLWALAVMLAFSMVAWVRADLIGVISGILWVGVLGLAALKLKGNPLLFSVQFLGGVQVLASLNAFAALFQVSLRGGHNDAAILQQATGIPQVFWASVWFLMSAAFLGFALRNAWRVRPQRPAQP